MAGENRDYVSWLHGQPCACHPCIARKHEIEASHPRTVKERASGKRLGGRPGKSQRADDTRAYPVCGRHHRQLQRYDFTKGYFAGWDKKQLEVWELEQGTLHYAKYLTELDTLIAGTATEVQISAALRRQGFDPIAFADTWGPKNSLSGQQTLDLGRDLRAALRAGGVPL